MNRIRLLATGAALMFALTAAARTIPNQDQQNQQSAQAGATAADQHLKMLTEKLDLTSDQQAKAIPMIQEMLDNRHKIMQDGSMSPQERHDQLKALHEKADKDLREMLTDDQKKKLDQLEQERHPESHGNPNGTGASN